MRRQYSFFIVMGLLLVVHIAHAQYHGTIEGTVTDVGTGEPLPGANVVITGTMLGASSDLDGHFRIVHVAPGSYTLKTTMMGYKALSQKITIEARATKTVDFALTQTVIETPALVVTAGKKAQSFQDVPNSVSIISSVQMKQKNFAYVSDVLEYTPGVTMVRGDVNIRGSSGFALGAGSRVLLLIDGIPLMPGDSGNIKWDIIPTSQVDRVEIVKGAGSAMYGSHALGGVVNIISKEPTVRPYTELRYTVGAYDKPRFPEWRWTDRILNFDNLDITHSQKSGKIGVLLSAGHRETTGFQQNGYYNRYNVLGRINWYFTPEKQLIIQSNYTTGKAGETFMWRNAHAALEMPLPNLGDYTSANKFSFNTVFRHLIGPQFTYKVRTSYFYNDWQQHYHDSDDYSKAHKIGMEIQGDYLLNGKQSLTFGVEAIYDITRSIMFGNHEASTAAAFVQDEVHVLPWITATVGFRFDRHDIDTGQSDEQFNPKFGLTIKPSQLSTIRMAIGRGFRSPTMAEMFSQTTTSGFKVIPNPNLKAEKAWSYEIGLNQILTGNMMLDIALFHNDYWNFIEPEPDIQNIVQFLNVNRARIRGVEITLQSGWWKRHLTSSLGYTYLDPIDMETGLTLAYRSCHTFNGNISLHFGQWETGLDARYASRMDEVKVYPDDDRVDQQVLDGRLSWNWSHGSITLNVNNIFNYNYVQVERNLAPIRHYMLTVGTHLSN
ncbi:TonB-dependent receptor [candidate division KSB1 bacterium]|nr:TonB-dependent receptor [candidate division KSB1 bacterium]